MSLDELILGKKPEVVIERIIEKDENRPMTIWEFWDKRWWLIFPIGIFLILIVSAL